jgi:hypothetical protein
MQNPPKSIDPRLVTSVDGDSRLQSLPPGSGTLPSCYEIGRHLGRKDVIDHFEEQAGLGAEMKVDSLAADARGSGYFIEANAMKAALF